MTRRVAIFVEQDGTRYASAEFNGDKAEFDKRCCMDCCDKNWDEIEPLFVSCKTLGDFIFANEEAQSFYHSCMPGQEVISVRQLEEAEDIVAGEVLVFYEEAIQK